MTKSKTSQSNVFLLNIGIYTVHKKFSNTKTCPVILLFKILYVNVSSLYDFDKVQGMT